MPESVSAYVSPDTGVATCYNDSSEISCPQQGEAYYGQDAQYAGFQPSYEDNGDGTITDRLTGLLWQRTDDGTTRTWSGAATYCQALSLGSRGVWRLPSPRELLTIVSPGRVDPALPQVFTSASGNYWTNKTDPASSDRAAFVSFSSGIASHELKYYMFRALCVSGGPLPDADFADNTDGTATDTTTGLMWEKAGSSPMNWENALAWCVDEADTGGYTDWRLPNKRELDSLVEGLPSNIFTELDWNWSSTTNSSLISAAWGVDFGIYRSNISYKTTQNRVRCVRGGLPGSRSATLFGVPSAPTPRKSAVITVGGEGVVSYKYMLDAGAWSDEILVGSPINLAGLSLGAHSIAAIGKDAGGAWQDAAAPTTAAWKVIASDAGLLELLLVHGDGE